MMKNSIVLACLLSFGGWGCSFGDRSVELTSDPPPGEPTVFRGVSVVLERPLDLRPGPHSIVGAVRSAVGVKTADMTTDQDVREWIREAMARELMHAGFLVAPSGNPGLALRIRTKIVELSSEEGIGFGAKLTLEIQVAGDAALLYKKTYQAKEHHLVITRTSGAEPADSLRICLRRVLAEFVQELVSVAESAPD